MVEAHPDALKEKDEVSRGSSRANAFFWDTSSDYPTQTIAIAIALITLNPRSEKCVVVDGPSFFVRDDIVCKQMVAGH